MGKGGDMSSQIPRKTFQVTSLQVAYPSIDGLGKWTNVLAGSLLAAYILRITIPAVWLTPISPYAVNFGGYFVLASALVYFLSSNLMMDAPALLLLLCVIVTIFFSPDLEIALSKGLLWILLFVVVGPLLSGVKGRAFRDLLWRWHKETMLIVTVLSFFWYMGRLPQYGKGVSGITLHCMLLGPFAALATIYATVKTLEARSYKYGLIASVSFLTCLASGSRSSALGAAAAVTMIPVLRIKSQALRLVCIIFLLAAVFSARSVFDFNSLDGSPVFKSGSPFEKYVAELQQKGMSNTREQLWKMRWNEFDSSPIVGIGIGVEEAGGSKTEYGSIVVEPGSSYLAILSMTGIIGALSFGILMVSLVMKVRKKWTFLESTDRTEIVAVGMFWAVHAVAEGWIFAGGSILCLFFWLWAGRLSNLGSLPPKRSLVS